MNTSNNFTVVGFICKNAEVINFEQSSIDHFGVSIKTTEKQGDVQITSSSIQSFETWIKNDDQALLELLKKGRRVKVEGFFKSETYQKDGKDHHVIKLIATSLSEVEKQKKEEAAQPPFLYLPCLSFQGYLLGSLGLMALGGWYYIYLISCIFILSYLFARGNLECESVHSFNGSVLGLVLYAIWIFDLQKG